VTEAAATQVRLTPAGQAMTNALTALRNL
jgi:hypothetical protein